MGHPFLTKQLSHQLNLLLQGRLLLPMLRPEKADDINTFAELGGKKRDDLA